MIKTGKIQTGYPRVARLQGIKCAIGRHDYVEVGTRADTLHHYSEQHQAYYRVTHTHSLLRCSCCAAETSKLADVDYVQVGHYERVFVSASG